MGFSFTRDYGPQVASLTGKGMMQLFFLGTDMRKQYIDIEAFVPEIFDNNFIYLRASDSSRTLQVSRRIARTNFVTRGFRLHMRRKTASLACTRAAAHTLPAFSETIALSRCEEGALLNGPPALNVSQSGAAFGMGMYPIGSGPMHFNSSLPPPLPIHTDDEGKDSIMEVRKAQCRRRLKADEKKWKATTGKRWLQEQADLIEEVSGLCGAEIRNQRNPFQAIKDINDAFVFAYKEGFPMIKVDGIAPACASSVMPSRALQFPIPSVNGAGR